MDYKDRFKKFELRAHAQSSLNKIMHEGLYGVKEATPLGTLRGLDVLPLGQILQKLSRATTIFAYSRGELPDFIKPKSFYEKLVLSKFFGPVPMPSPADKLSVASFIPEDLRERVKMIPVLWSGHVPITEALLQELNLAPGKYYAKSNCGSGTNFVFNWPADDKTVARLTALSQNWLKQVYGQKAGEWWYGLIRNQVFIEADFAPEAKSLTDWKFHTGGGRVLAMQIDRDRASNHSQLMYDREHNFLPGKMFFKTGKPDSKPVFFDEMRDIAEQIGAQFEFARVDFYYESDQFYLGEVTLAPLGGQRVPVSSQIDALMGAAWISGRFGTN